MATVEQARAALDAWLERKIRPTFYRADGWQQAKIAAGTPPQGATYNYVDIVVAGDTGRGLTRATAYNANGLTLTTGDLVWVAKNLRGALVIKELYT